MEISISLDPSSNKDLPEYLKFLNAVENISIHCDVMDGSFVPRKAITRDQYQYVCKKSKHKIDVHLMIEKVAENLGFYLSNCCRGSIRSICFHTEAITYPMDKSHSVDSPPISPKAISLVEEIRVHGIEGGIAIDLDTDLDDIDPNLLFMCDVITVMSVKAGASGQSFNKSALAKVRRLKKSYPNARIILDGGINMDNIQEVKRTGVDIAVVGNAVYSSEGRLSTIKILQNV